MYVAAIQMRDGNIITLKPNNTYDLCTELVMWNSKYELKKIWSERLHTSSLVEYTPDILLLSNHLNSYTFNIKTAEFKEFKVHDQNVGGVQVLRLENSTIIFRQYTMIKALRDDRIVFTWPKSKGSCFALDRNSFGFLDGVSVAVCNSLSGEMKTYPLPQHTRFVTF
jgi:hypothetical protein